MPHVAFIGAGKMASAMVRGLLAQRLYPPTALACLGGDDPTAAHLAQSAGIHCAANPHALLAHADIVVLACKPQQLANLDPSYTDLTRGKLLLSILAGTPLAKLRARFPHARNLVRAMPNTPGQIGAGITAYCAQKSLDPADHAAIEKILGSLGAVLELPENDLDPVTAVSGSGPAYLFEFTAAFRDAAIATGLSPAVAEKLVHETVRGAAKLMEITGEHPDKLRDAVTSPGGTTEAALNVLKAGHFRDLLKKAVAAAHQRSLDLAKL
jgi:pyrroline-5-carboxylate reductase